MLGSGRVLFGPDARTILPPITVEMVLAGLRKELEYLREGLTGVRMTNGAYRAYAVLTMCRIRYTLHTGTVTSKPQAARWAARRHAEYADLIECALGHDGSSRQPGNEGGGPG